MAKKIRDTDYLALSAYLRAMENQLLTKDRMERILEAPTDAEAEKLLQECGDYGGIQKPIPYRLPECPRGIRL